MKIQGKPFRTAVRLRSHRMHSLHFRFCVASTLTFRPRLCKSLPGSLVSSDKEVTKGRSRVSSALHKKAFYRRICGRFYPRRVAVCTASLCAYTLHRSAIVLLNLRYVVDLRCMNTHIQHKEICRIRGLFQSCQPMSLYAIESSSTLCAFLATRLFSVATPMTLSHLTDFHEKS